MPAIVYHIGIFDKRDEPDYVKYVIKSQMTILSKHCKSADIYIGMHADEEQIEMIMNLAKEVDLKIKDTMSYQHDLWEVPTVEWLQNEIAHKYEQSDYISYLHSKGITRHDDVSRNYLMDYLFVQYEDNLKYMNDHPKFDAAVCCTHMDSNLKNIGFHYSFWMAKVKHILNIPAPERGDSRWASEHFMKLKLGEFLPLDERVCLHRPENHPKSVMAIPSQYMRGDAYSPSEALREVIVPLQIEYKVTEDEKPVEPKPAEIREIKIEPKQAPKTNLHLIYSIPLAITTLLFITFFLLYLRK